MPTTCSVCGKSYEFEGGALSPVAQCPNCRDTTSQGSGTPSPDAPKPILLQRTCPACGTKFPAERDLCPKCRTNYMDARGLGGGDVAEHDMFAPERAALNVGFWGGVLLIVIAVGWFVGGYQSGYIFFYPPILAVIGIYGVVRGLGTRKVAQSRGARRARHPRRRRGSRGY